MEDTASTIRSMEQLELHECLYASDISRVHVASDKRSGQRLALKTYNKKKLSAFGRVCVSREVRIHAQLSHPNIVKLYTSFEDEKYVYLLLELLPGDLLSTLTARGRLTEEGAVLDVIVPLLRALSYLHGLGIIHRDIKPENILLTACGQVVLADFGLVIDVNEERPVSRVGTLDFMAPEVLHCPALSVPENKQKEWLWYTDRVDSWAIGVLAYEMLVGSAPFESESREEVCSGILDREPVYAGWTSRGAKNFIKAALSKVSSTRPSAAQMLAHPWIRSWLRWEGEGDATAGPADDSMAEAATSSRAVAAVDCTPLAPRAVSSHCAAGHEEKGGASSSQDMNIPAAAAKCIASITGEEPIAACCGHLCWRKLLEQASRLPEEPIGCDEDAQFQVSETASHVAVLAILAGDLTPGDPRAAGLSSPGYRHSSGRSAAGSIISDHLLQQDMLPRPSSGPPSSTAAAAAAAIAVAHTAPGSSSRERPIMMGSSPAAAVSCVTPIVEQPQAGIRNLSSSSRGRPMGSSSALAPATGVSLDALTLNLGLLAALNGPKGGIIKAAAAARAATAPERALNVAAAAAGFNRTRPVTTSSDGARQFTGVRQATTSLSGAASAPAPTSQRRLPPSNGLGEAAPSLRPTSSAARPATASVMIISAAARPASRVGMALQPSGSRWLSGSISCGTSPAARKGSLAVATAAFAAMRQRPANPEGGNCTTTTACSAVAAAAGSSQSYVPTPGSVAPVPSFLDYSGDSTQQQGRRRPGSYKPILSQLFVEGKNPALGAARYW